VIVLWKTWRCGGNARVQMHWSIFVFLRKHVFYIHLNWHVFVYLLTNSWQHFAPSIHTDTLTDLCAYISVHVFIHACCYERKDIAKRGKILPREANASILIRLDGSDTPLIDHLVMREFVSGPPSYCSIHMNVCVRKPSLEESSWAVCGFRIEFFEKRHFFGKLILI